MSTPREPLPREEIDAVKTGADLAAVVRSRGIELKRNGKSLMGLCPFHDDKNPSFSVTPEKNLWQCFGCGAAGDVIRFVQLFDNVGFMEAVRLLTGGNSSVNSSPVSSDHLSVNSPPDPPHPDAGRCLDRVITLYKDNFIKKDAARSYLEKRGITDAGLLDGCDAGFCDGTLHKILPGDGEIRDVLKQTGILLANGGERFAGCAVFPVRDADGRLTTIYGRNINNNSPKKHLFLPGRPTGLWNAACLKNCDEIILTESVIDALSVRTAGFHNAAAVQGTNGLTGREIAALKAGAVRKVVLLMDGDAPGRSAAKRLKEKLSGLAAETLPLPDGHDPNSFLLEHGAEKLGEFIRAGGREALPVPTMKEALPAAAPRTAEPPAPSPEEPPLPEPPPAPEPEAPLPEPPAIPLSPAEPGGFTVACGIRNYRIMSLDKGPNKLKITLRLEHAGKLHIDTLDLYAARARTKLAADICRTFDALPETVEAEIGRIIRECEAAAERPEEAAEAAPKIPPVTGRDKEIALAFGRSPDLTARILDDFAACGLIGEEANKLLGYIAMTSRKRNDPISVQILSSSGAGKTALQDAVTAFCPPEDLVKLTSLSGKALFYKDRMSLKHKVLALEEGDGAEEAAYAIRSLISAGELINETTIKDLNTGRLTTMENRVEGPTAVFYTTTNPDVDPETKSRFFVTGIDESREQTRKILAFQRRSHQKDGKTTSVKTKAIIKKHLNFQRLIKPFGVRNPYSGRLTYGDDRLQGRRDQPKYLNLIKSAAFLRQMQKPVKTGAGNAPYIEVDLEDIRIANDLAREILGRSLDELSRPGRDLLLLLDEMIEKQWAKIQKKGEGAKLKRTAILFTRRDIREYTGWSNYRVHTHLKELVSLEYVLLESGRNGSIHRYRLPYEGQGKDGAKFIMGLSDPENLPGK